MVKPTGPVARAGEYLVVENDHSAVKALVERFHYSHSAANTSVAAHGLFKLTEEGFPLQVGGALWMPPTPVAARSVTPAGLDWRGVINLSRLVVVPGEPQNATGILLSRSLRLIAKDRRWHTAVTWADTGQGHTGTIYKATNWVEVGEGRPKNVWKDTKGCIVGIKKANYTRSDAEMRELGYTVAYTSSKKKFVFDLRRFW